MNTPICVFLRDYAATDTVRMHMPGHKGVGGGAYPYDITEIRGADSLYEAEGIIRESEQNASRLFGCPTYYSAEGSSLAIRAMLALVRQYAQAHGKPQRILALPNIHKSLISAVALLDMTLDILYPEAMHGYLSCRPTVGEIEARLADPATRPVAFFVTSPDYLGGVSDIRMLAELCHRYGVLLLVDGAHGAYLRFLPEDASPMSLGADMACASAHKTLPALTGAAYLYLSDALDTELSASVKDAMALFGSTSPSYLILASLDALNARLDGEYRQKLSAFLERLTEIKEALTRHGYILASEEPMKLTLLTKPYGYLGTQLADILRARGIECEHADADHLVLMPSPDTGDEELSHLCSVLLSVEKCQEILTPPPAYSGAPRVLPIREALLAPAERLPLALCEGRVLASLSVSCPPAVPIALPGERLTEEALAAFSYYGISECSVIK